MLRRGCLLVSPWKAAAPLIRRRALHRTLNTSHTSVDHSNGSSGGGFFTPSPHPNSPSTGSSPHQPQGDKNGKGSRGRTRVSDQEYNVRVGRAFDLLRATMPDFMRTGLVDYHHTQASQPNGLTLLDVFTFRALRAKDANINTRETEEMTSAAADQVYDAAIHFRFCPAPPTNTSSIASTEPDLTEEEAASLSFSGRSLYFASAHVLRHTLNVLFANTRVEVKKIRMECRGAKPRMDDVLHLRFEFTGNLRMTGQEHQYTLIFRYDFDSDTGRIIRHTVEKVEPAIGRKVRTPQ